ncbi:MAG: hypothetical protein JNM76_18100 [Betaproteobacteria bacterium]|nr:hypothetical protein [Betaproteobacteria bacterium]
MKVRLQALLFTVALGLWGQAVAQGNGAGTVESKLEVSKVVVKDGKDSLEPAGAARPGDVLQYVANYTNKGRAGVTNLEATLPIPPNTELIIDSIKPSGAKASIGGSTFGDIPLKRKVRQANGVEFEQIVPVREYRSLRWYPGALAAGATVSFTARVKVVDDRQAPQKQ